jgi:hypothetical protein
MAAVLIIGLSLGLGLPAAEVYRAEETHYHGFLARRADSRWAIDQEEVPAPFWPRYWLRLRGKPWIRQPVCVPRPGKIDEVCDIVQPESFLPSCFSLEPFFFIPSIEMRRKERALNGLEPDPRLEPRAGMGY